MFIQSGVITWGKVQLITLRKLQDELGHESPLSTVQTILSAINYLYS